MFCREYIGPWLQNRASGLLAITGKTWRSSECKFLGPVRTACSFYCVSNFKKLLENKFAVFTDVVYLVQCFLRVIIRNSRRLVDSLCLLGLSYFEQIPTEMYSSDQ